MRKFEIMFNTCGIGYDDFPDKPLSSDDLFNDYFFQQQRQDRLPGKVAEAETEEEAQKLFEYYAPMCDDAQCIHFNACRSSDTHEYCVQYDILYVIEINDVGNIWILPYVCARPYCPEKWMDRR